MTAALKHTVSLSCPNYAQFRVSLAYLVFKGSLPRAHSFLPHALSAMAVILIWELETPTGHVRRLTSSDSWCTSFLCGF